MAIPSTIASKQDQFLYRHFPRHSKSLSVMNYTKGFQTSLTPQLQTPPRHRNLQSPVLTTLTSRAENRITPVVFFNIGHAAIRTSRPDSLFQRPVQHCIWMTVAVGIATISLMPLLNETNK